MWPMMPNHGILVYKDREQEFWTQQNGYLSWGRQRPNLKGCSAEGWQGEGEEAGGGGQGGDKV